MKKGRNPRIKSILTITFCLLFCIVSIGKTADHIRLRKYPSPDGPVLDTFSKKQDFKIIESYGAWRYVVIDGSTYGGGWIHSEDLKRDPTEKPDPGITGQRAKADEPGKSSSVKTKKAVNKSSSKGNITGNGGNRPPLSSRGKVTLGAVKIHPVSVHKGPAKTETDTLSIKAPDPKKDPPVPAAKPEKDEAGKDLMLQQPATEKEDRVSHDKKPAAAEPAQHGHLEPKKDFHPPEKEGMTLIKTAYAEAIPTEKLAADGFQKSPLGSPALFRDSARTSETGLGLSQANAAQDFVPSKETAAPPQNPMRDIINLFFRLLSVVLSCLAIVLAYRAKRMAEMGYHLVVQLQQAIENHRRREFDDRY